MPIEEVYELFHDNIDKDSTILWFRVKAADGRSAYFHVDYEQHPAFVSLHSMLIMPWGSGKFEKLHDEALNLLAQEPSVLPDFSELPQIEDTSPAMQEVFSQLEASDSMMAYVDFEDHLWDDLDLTQEAFENQIDADIDKFLLRDVIEKNQDESLYICYADLLTRFSMPPSPERVQDRKTEEKKQIVPPADRNILILDKNDRSHVIYEGPLTGKDQDVLYAIKGYREKLESSLPLVDKLILEYKKTPFASPNAIPLLELHKYGAIKKCFYRDPQQPDFKPVPCIITNCRYLGDFKQECFNVLYIDPEKQEENTGRGTWAYPSNLIIETGPNTSSFPSRNTQLLNRHGLVSKEQLERLDAIIEINKKRGNRKPKGAAERFAYKFVQRFKTKYMEDTEDIKRFKLSKITRYAAMEMLINKFTPNEIVKTILEYSPAPCITNGDQQERMKFAMETVLDAQRTLEQGKEKGAELEAANR